MRAVPIALGAGLMVLTAGMGLSTAHPEAAGSLKPVSDFSDIANEKDRSVAIFTEAGKVIQNPRCVNCHPAGNRPRQGDDGHPHQPLVVRGAGGFGAVIPPWYGGKSDAVTLAIGACVFTVMTTWRQGRGIMFRRLQAQSVPLTGFLESLFRDPPTRVPGTAIFLTATPDATPNALMHNLNHNKVLHERVVFLTADVTEEPWVPFQDRVRLTKLGHGCWRLNVRFGFMNEEAMEDQTRRTLGRLKLRLPSLSKLVESLSGGQRQAVAIARAMPRSSPSAAG